MEKVLATHTHPPGGAGERPCSSGGKPRGKGEHAVALGIPRQSGDRFMSADAVG